MVAGFTSGNVRGLQPSLIRKLANQAMGREGVIPLWFGEPDVVTPEFIREAAKHAIDEGLTFYQANAGITPLREALVSHMNRIHSTTFDINNVIVTSSGMAAVALANQAVLSAGDEVVIVSPIWPNLPSVPAILGAVVKRIPLTGKTSGWELDLDTLFDAVTDKTRAMFINSPNNPTGWMLSDEEQQTVLDFCRERGLWLIADEVYNRIVYSGQCAPTFADKVTDEDRFLIVNSFSKSWAMTGWRLGWLTAPRSLTTQLEMLVEYNFSCVFQPTQVAGIAALEHGEQFVQDSIVRYGAARDLLVERLGAFERVFFPVPDAAFYAFFSVDGVTDSFAFAEEALVETGVGLAPGAAFGPEGEGFLRLCFAAELDILEQAIERLSPLLR